MVGALIERNSLFRFVFGSCCFSRVEKSVEFGFCKLSEILVPWNGFLLTRGVKGWSSESGYLERSSLCLIVLCALHWPKRIRTPHRPEGAPSRKCSTRERSKAAVALHPIFE